MNNTTTRKGILHEQLVEHFLCKHGLRTLHRRYFCHYGEIDLIMQKNHDEIIVVEVKSRATKPDAPLLLLDRKKQTKLIQTTLHYLQEQKQEQEDCSVRYDFVYLHSSNKKIYWFKNCLIECYDHPVEPHTQVF